AVKDRIVALHSVSVGSKVEYRLHQYLRAIDLNRILSGISPADQCHPDDMFIAPGRLRELYASYPFIISNTEKLMNGCSISILEGSKTLKTFSGSARGDRQLLE